MEPAEPGKHIGVFARNASGLVRNASLLDAFFIAFMNNAVAVGIWTVTSPGSFLFPGGDHLTATIIAFLLSISGMSLVWGMLSGSMPRSGGSYVYNTRIIHPAVGMAVSFGDLFIWVLYIGILSPWAADPGLTTWLGAIGAPEAAISSVSSTMGIFIIGTIVNVWAAFIVFRGLKSYFLNQKVIGILSIITLTVTIVLFYTVTPEGFRAIWNSVAAQYGSLDYQGMITAANNLDPTLYAPTLPPTLAMFGLVVVNAYLYHYGFAVTMIGGEVKRPQKNLLFSQWAAAIVPFIFMIAFIVIAQTVMGANFITALAAQDNAGLEGYTMPQVANFVGVASILSQNLLIRGIVGAAMFFSVLLWVPISYVAGTRIMVAWGMDRMGPGWIADVSPRWASPVKSVIAMFIIGEAGIFIYTFSPGWLVGLAVTATEAASIFGVTALAALIFPFRKKVKHIWDASPFSTWKLAGIPVISLAAAIELFYVVLMLYFFYTTPGLYGFTDMAILFFLAIWVVGALWYYYWRWKGRRAGADVDLAWKELPPE